MAVAVTKGAAQMVAALLRARVLLVDLNLSARLGVGLAHNSCELRCRQLLDHRGNHVALFLLRVGREA